MLRTTTASSSPAAVSEIPRPLRSTRGRPKNCLPVFYTPKMLARPRSYSPSAGKPAEVVASWAASRLPLDLHEPTPATRDELARAHDRGWVDAVLACRADNGFGERSLEVAASLPYTTGAMLSAARHARTKGGIVCAPCSGFHHAGPRTATGFCTFNGLVVTALALRAEGLATRVGILDCDMHYGDGTDAILDALGVRSSVLHFSVGAEYGNASDAARFFADLPRIVQSMCDCDVVLYQAGADPHVDDPLGGWLTTDELRLRDRIVFEQLVAHSVPVAWNLAGGYQRDASGGIPKVLEIHENTAREALRALDLAR